jgi:hypothetical protein
MAALIRAKAGDIFRAERNRPACRLFFAGDDVEQRGLAGAVRSDQPQNLAFRHAERHVLEGDDAAEDLSDALSLEKRNIRHTADASFRRMDAVNERNGRGALASPVSVWRV